MHLKVGIDALRLMALVMDVLRFNFIHDSNFIFLCFKLIIIHYNTQEQKKRKFEPILYIDSINR